MYSDNPRTREQVQLALGKRVHPELPELSYLEVATAPMVIKQMDAGGFDLVILDGEATLVGGMGIAKQLKDEIADCPPILVLTGRPDDAWLALVACGSRGSTPDRPDSSGRRGGVAAAHRCNSSPREFPVAVGCSRHGDMAARAANSDTNQNAWHATQTPLGCG